MQTARIIVLVRGSRPPESGLDGSLVDAGSAEAELTGPVVVLAALEVGDVMLVELEVGDADVDVALVDVGEEVEEGADVGVPKSDANP